MDKALIFLNGDMSDPAFFKKLINEKTYLIGADGGADHIHELGFMPHAVVGDFDSLKNIPDEIRNLKPRENGSQLEVESIIYKKYPIDKDFLDSELAIDLAIEHGIKKIELVTNLSIEVDQVMGTFFVIGKEKYKDLDIKIIQPNLEAFIISGEVKLTGKPGQKISLIPLYGEVKVKSSSGLKYNPSNYKMNLQANSGISNELINNFLTLNILRGRFLIIRH